MENKELGKKIKVWRAEKGWTQKELAKKSKVGLCTLALIETGKPKHKARYTTLNKLANAFKKDVNELYDLIK